MGVYCPLTSRHPFSQEWSLLRSIRWSGTPDLYRQVESTDSVFTLGSSKYLGGMSLAPWSQSMMFRSVLPLVVVVGVTATEVGAGAAAKVLDMTALPMPTCVCVCQNRLGNGLLRWVDLDHIGPIIPALKQRSQHHLLELIFGFRGQCQSIGTAAMPRQAG